MTTSQEIIQNFTLYFGDETSLSSVEELALLQKKYNQVLQSAEWEFLKKTATGSVSGTDITQPSDFDRLTTDQNIYIGTNYQQFNVIPFTDRLRYRNMRGYFYYDARQEKFISTYSVSDTYTFDYIYVPPALNTTDSDPVFPVRFYDLLYHAMCIDADIINMSDKARSYASTNQMKYEDILNQMKSWNMKISGFNTYGI